MGNEGQEVQALGKTATAAMIPKALGLAFTTGTHIRALDTGNDLAEEAGPLATPLATRSNPILGMLRAPPHRSETHVYLLGELSLQVQDEGVEVFEIQVWIEGRIKLILKVASASLFPCLLLFVLLAVTARHVVIVRSRQEVPPTHAPVASISVAWRAFWASSTARPRHHLWAR